MTGYLLLDLALLGIPLAIGGLWWTGTRAKELAIEHARAACRRESVQLLDQTVSLNRIRLARSATGAMCLRRNYGFEFTQEGAHRDHGTITMRGHTLLRVHFPYTRDVDGNRVFLH